MARLCFTERSVTLVSMSHHISSHEVTSHVLPSTYEEGTIRHQHNISHARINTEQKRGSSKGRGTRKHSDRQTQGTEWHVVHEWEKVLRRCWLTHASEGYCGSICRGRRRSPSDRNCKKHESRSNRDGAGDQSRCLNSDTRNRV